MSSDYPVNSCVWKFRHKDKSIPFDEVLMTDPFENKWSWRRSEGGNILLYASIDHATESSPEDWMIWTEEETQPEITAKVHELFDTHAK